jgi:hypothetical protein
MFKPCQLAVSAALLLAPFAASAESTPDATQDPTYAAATRELNDQHWADAARDFDKVIAAHGPNTDAAMYWKAYALQKLNRTSDALAICGNLQAKFPSSSWNTDCTTLTVSNNIPLTISISNDGKTLTTTSTSSSFWNKGWGKSKPATDEDIQMLAVNSLMYQDPAQAIPMLRSILTSNRSEDFKQHAFFVLTQSKSPEANALLHDALVGKLGPDNQLHAIQAAGVFKGRVESPTLLEIYRTTESKEVKEAVLSALFLANDATNLVDLARAEKNLDRKEEIVSRLAMMKNKAATEYMLELLK